MGLSSDVAVGRLLGGVTGIGPVTLGSLLDVKRFGIVAVHVPDHCLNREIRWVTVTEMVDPAPYLLGDELILTLGISWPDPASPDIARFIERLSSAGVSAVGITVGIQHDTIPESMIAAARAHELALIEIPLATSFRSVAEYIVNQMVGDRYAVARRTLEVHDALTEALLSRQGLYGLISRLCTMLGAPVAVVDYHGSVVASQPPSEEWPVAALVSARGEIRYGSRVGDVVCYPVSVSNHNVAFVCAKDQHDTHEVIRFALGLVALEFSRQQAEMNGRRELIGQVIGDLVQGDISDAEAQRRLARSGIDLMASNRIVLAHVDCPADRLVDVPWNGDRFLPDQAGRYLVALVDGLVAVVVPEGIDLVRLAHAMRDHLGRLGTVSVGVGGQYPAVTGLRVSWFEAQEALSHGPGVNHRRPMSLSRLMLANLKLPLRHIGEEMLRPLLDYDREHDTALVETLRTFVENDCQPSAAAQALFIHRNTLRYRLQLIERLTDRNLSSFVDLVNLYLAILALSMESVPPSRG